MPRNSWKSALLAAVLALASCGTGPDAETVEGGPRPPSLLSDESIPPQLRGGGTPLRPQGVPAELRDDAGTVLDPAGIVFTDPDAENPDNISDELRELFEAVPKEGPWRQSYVNACREARLTGKPVLMWFTDSQNSPNCKALSEELFTRRDFEEWAGESLIRLQLDQRVQGSKLNHEAATKADYIQSLKKQYKVLGQPTMLVLTPAGEVIGRYRGYRRGEFEFKWGQLRQAVFLAQKAHAKWIGDMEKKGYRVWSDPRGRRIFAKLVAYRDGELYLIEPDGTRAKTKERHLSQQDRDWIAQEKAKRGL